MVYPRSFTSVPNLALAFSRVVRGQNREYKNFFRHLYPSYQLSLADNLRDLGDDLKKDRYKPSPAISVYQPKTNGILRPLRLLCLQDQVVYQAIANLISVAFQKTQEKHAFKRCFGAISAGKTSPFFFRSWKQCYRKYDKAVVKAFKSGNEYVADFDLVSFFELIDHKLLREVLAKKLKNAELLELLFRCLEKWTENPSGSSLHHGIPQGPEPSAFLAECFLFCFDEIKFRDLAYLRYVDDIRLMAKSETPLRRALLKLDISSKHVGLVPQAQKIELRRVSTLNALRKTVPSAIVTATRTGRITTTTQRRLERIFKRSIEKKKGQWIIVDITKFKFSVFRMKPKRFLLRRIAKLLDSRPDLSWLFASYFSKFPKDPEAADFLLKTLQKDPTYDASAASYISAMDVCEPLSHSSSYRRVIQTAERRSEERSVLLQIAATVFRGRRSGPRDAVKLINKLESTLGKGLAIHSLFGRAGTSPYKTNDGFVLLHEGTQSLDPDLARFCVDLLLDLWPWTGSHKWTPPASMNNSAKLLLKGIGLRSRRPNKRGILNGFFEDKIGIGTVISWKRALKNDWRDAERRCIRLQNLQLGDPASWVLMLDTFNEVLIQALSKHHTALKGPYKTATPPKSAQPDFGNWLNQPSLAVELPKGITWFQEVHRVRVAADLAHAKSRKGRSTKAVPSVKRDQLSRAAKIPWAELIRKLETI